MELTNKTLERGKVFHDILRLDMGNVVEGEIVESVKVEKEETAEIVVGLDEAGVRKDERNEIVDYKDIDTGVLYLEDPTKWIYAQNSKLPIVSPRDKETMTKIMYEELGHFNSILEGLNWHVSCKKELLRWIRNHELSDDLMVAREGIVDESEVVLKESVRTKDIDSAKFVLKTVGKKRGWNEKEMDEREKNNVYAYVNVTQVNTTGLKELSDSDLTKLLEDQIKGL